MTSINDMVGTLKLFDERVDHLVKNPFFSSDHKVNFSFNFETKIMSTKDGLPKDYEFDSLVLTIRLFIQNNDKISIGNIAEIYKKLPISKKILDAFNNCRKLLNDFLNTGAAVYNDKHFTRREIMDTIIYGQMAHLVDKKQDLYNRWRKNEFTWLTMKSEFDFVLTEISRSVQYIQSVNKAVYEELKLMEK